MDEDPLQEITENTDLVMEPGKKEVSVAVEDVLIIHHVVVPAVDEGEVHLRLPVILVITITHLHLDHLPQAGRKGTTLKEVVAATTENRMNLIQEVAEIMQGLPYKQFLLKKVKNLTFLKGSCVLSVLVSFLWHMYTDTTEDMWPICNKARWNLLIAGN